MARTKDPDRTRELLDACCDYVERTGLGDLTLRPMAEGVGVSPRTLLYHFGSREELIIAVIRRSRERGLADVAALLTGTGGDEARDSGSGSIGELVEGLAAALWQTSLADTARPFLLLFYEAYVMSLRKPDTFRQLLDQLSAEAQQAIRDALERAGVDATNADFTASEIVAIHRGLQLEWLATGRTEELTEAHRRAIARVAHAISSSE
ncbi:TetR/AcrR family transcriptional regulator [Tsukamurella sp. 8F]|uniref:TetR/AcrR family transcriptional regulator n=1 Tax=unclassified Tsukamurella TaxID=2633480 RepID=UPI0023BA01B8|nr:MULTISPECIES: TetR/AcrR family transcriptional regulator [unclassified Tsukamurella]MDF0530390.1 TetR/AcrR family transcriptional regulator [Tsukamurella sp. 8J]MDF0587789.1 TetR/AcrR family transcriptional regulator [Tsukamurella sp. 8F]